MATTKVTVTLPYEQLERIRLLVEGRQASSVSGFVQRAVATVLDEMAAWAAMLSSALDETGGPMSDEERAWADAVLSRSAPKSTAGSKRDPGNAA